MRTALLIGILLGTGVTAVSPRGVSAHPHVWVDASLVLHFDGKGLLTSFTEVWDFDESFSSYVLAEHDADKDGRFDEKETRNVRDYAFINLKEYGFYTHVHVDGKEKPVVSFRDFSASIRGERVVYRFTVDLAASVDPFEQDVQIGIYDEEYYVDVQYVEDPVRLDGMEKDCPCTVFDDKDHPVYMGMVYPPAIRVCRP